MPSDLERQMKELEDEFARLDEVKSPILTSQEELANKLRLGWRPWAVSGFTIANIIEIIDQLKPKK